MHYNAACVLARLGERDRAAAHLMDAIRAGFADFSHLRRDQDLRSLRGHRTYQTILRAREMADGMLADRQLVEWRRGHDPAAYRYAGDPQRRLHLAAAIDQPQLDAIRAAVEAQFDHLSATLFPGALRSYALIVVPEAGQADALIGDKRADGRYQHGLRRLVVRSADRALQHELVHLLHHRHMDALGQAHPAWIQEGLATLYEAHQLSGEGNVTFAANDRDEAATYMLSRHQLRGWRTVMTLTEDDFSRDAARLYPQVRSMMRFIDERVGVRAWYAVYVAAFDTDATGAASLQAAFGQPLDEIEQAWREWLKRQPVVVRGQPQRPTPRPAEAALDEPAAAAAEPSTNGAARDGVPVPSAAE
jgi:hypothetical protein